MNRREFGGLGLSALQGVSASTGDGVEAFDVPAHCADLALAKTATPDPVVAGDDLGAWLNHRTAAHLGRCAQCRDEHRALVDSRATARRLAQEQTPSLQADLVGMADSHAAGAPQKVPTRNALYPGRCVSKLE